MAITVPVDTLGVLNKNWTVYKDPYDPGKPLGQGLLFSDDLDYGYLKRMSYAVGGISGGGIGIGAFMKFTFPIVRPVNIVKVATLLSHP